MCDFVGQVASPYLLVKEPSILFILVTLQGFVILAKISHDANGF